jgi:hypothetical protein
MISVRVDLLVFFAGSVAWFTLVMGLAALAVRQARRDRRH